MHCIRSYRILSSKPGLFPGFPTFAHFSSLSLLLSPSCTPAHFSRINLFRSGKVAVTTTLSRESRGKKGEGGGREEKSQVIYSPLKEPPSGAFIFLFHLLPIPSRALPSLKHPSPCTNGQILPSGRWGDYVAYLHIATKDKKKTRERIQHHNYSYIAFRQMILF